MQNLFLTFSQLTQLYTVFTGAANVVLSAQGGFTCPWSLAGECSCHEGYAPDPMHRHLCVRTDWGHSEG